MLIISTSPQFFLIVHDGWLTLRNSLTSRPNTARWNIDVNTLTYQNVWAHKVDIEPQYFNQPSKTKQIALGLCCSKYLDLLVLNVCDASNGKWENPVLTTHQWQLDRSYWNVMIFYGYLNKNVGCLHVLFCKITFKNEHHLMNNILIFKA